MPAERRVGMDHPHYSWSPLPTRPVLRWPGQARVALCVIVNLGHTEWQPPQDSLQQPWPAPAATVTAGMVDDNADFNAYLAFRQRTRVGHRPRDIRERYLLDVDAPPRMRSRWARLKRR